MIGKKPIVLIICFNILLSSLNITATETKEKKNNPKNEIRSSISKGKELIKSKDEFIRMQGIELLQKAELLGSAEAARFLGKLYWSSPTFKAPYKSYHFFKKGAQKGDKESKIYLAYYSASGLAGPKQRKQGLEKLEAFANENSPLANFFLGECFYLEPMHNFKTYETNYEIAYTHYNKAAKLGFSPAFEKLGSMYYDGLYVEKDIKRANHFYNLFLQDRKPFHLAEVAFRYFMGEGINQDKKESLTLLKEAAKGKYLPAMVWLGSEYQFGDEVPKDYAKALSLYKEAAHLGSHEALIKLSIMYKKGLGVHKDEELAKYYLEKFENSGNGNSNWRTAFKFTGPGRTEDINKHIYWLEKAASKSFSPAFSMLGKIYSQGKIVPKNPAKALKYLSIFAEEGDMHAQHNFGKEYYQGKWIKKDLEKALYWLKKAAESGNTSSKELLIKMILKNEIFQEKENKQTLIESIIGNNRVTQYDFGMMLANGENIKINQKEAIKWLLKSAKQNYPKAQAKLGSMYMTGQGVEKDPIKGWNWVLKSLDKKDRLWISDLASKFLHGDKGYPSNFEKAEYLYNYCLSIQNDKFVQYSLYELYSHPASTLLDFDKAFNHLFQSITLSKESLNEFELMDVCKTLERVIQTYNTEETTKEIIKRFFPKDKRQLLYKLGKLFHEGVYFEIEKNHHYSFNLLKISAERGNSKASKMIEEFYQNYIDKD